MTLLAYLAAHALLAAVPHSPANCRTRCQRHVQALRNTSPVQVARPNPVGGSPESKLAASHAALLARAGLAVQAVSLLLRTAPAGLRLAQPGADDAKLLAASQSLQVSQSQAFDTCRAAVQLCTCRLCSCQTSQSPLAAEGLLCPGMPPASFVLSTLCCRRCCWASCRVLPMIPCPRLRRQKVRAPVPGTCAQLTYAAGLQPTEQPADQQTGRQAGRQAHLPC